MFYVKIFYRSWKGELDRLTHPLRTPRMRFMTKNAPRTTIETKKVTAT